ncbi:MAG: hypothetical protein V4760_08235, partial [Bdellovibrionota bacterium]
FGCLAMFALRSVDEESPKLAWISSVLAFVTMASYPTTAVSIFILWTLIVVARLALKQPVWKYFFIANVPAAVFLLSYFGLLVYRFDWENIVMSYRYHTAHTSLGAFLPKQLYGLWLTFGFAPWWWLMGPLFVAWIFLWRKWRVNWLFFLVPVAIFTATGIKEKPENGTWAQSIILIGCFSAIGLIIPAIARDFRTKWREVVLWGAGLTSATIICWTSGMTYYSTHYAALYALTGAMVLAMYQTASRWTTASLLLLALVFTHQQHHAFLDEDNSERPMNLTEWIDWGPYAGFLTYPEQHDYLRRLQADLNDVAVDRESVVFYNSFPAGYLFTNLRPQTRGIHIHGLEQSAAVKPFFRAWYDNPINRPDVVVRFTGHMGAKKGSIWNVDAKQFHPYKDVFWYFPEETGDYDLFVERKLYSIFVRKGTGLKK